MDLRSVHVEWLQGFLLTGPRDSVLSRPLSVIEIWLSPILIERPFSVNSLYSKAFFKRKLYAKEHSSSDSFWPSRLFAADLPFSLSFDVIFAFELPFNCSVTYRISFWYFQGSSHFSFPLVVLSIDLITDSYKHEGYGMSPIFWAISGVLFQVPETI